MAWRSFRAPSPTRTASSRGSWILTATRSSCGSRSSGTRATKASRKALFGEVKIGPLWPPGGSSARRAALSSPWSALHRLDERSQRGRDLAATRIVEVKSWEARAPIVEHGFERTVGEMGRHLRLEGEAN